MPAKRRKKRILVIEDDEITREMLQRTLSRAGFRVSTAPNGLKLVSSLNVSKPDLILLDVMMSWVNGIELCRLIGRIREYRDVPVIFVSGHSDAKTIEECKAAGGVEFIAKPIDLALLISAVKKYLGIGADG